MFAYEDGQAAMDWLANAFGFQEVRRIMGKDGRLSHGEMRVGDGLIILAAPSPDYHSPKRHREECEQAKLWLKVPYIVDGALVYVEDVEEHLGRSRANGAVILSEIEESSVGKHYRAEDIEGHRWMFMQRYSVSA